MINPITQLFIDSIGAKTNTAYTVILDTTKTDWSATYTTKDIACAVLDDFAKSGIYGVVIDESTGELVYETDIFF